MVMTLSLWGSDQGTMSWLDQMTGCQGACNQNSDQVHVSNIKIANQNNLDKFDEEKMLILPIIQ